MSARHLVVAVSSTVLVAVVAGVWWQRQARVDPAPTLPSPVAVTPTLPTPSGAACRFTRGQTFAFAYQSETHYRVTVPLPGAREAMPQTGTAELQGQLTFEVLDGAAHEATLLGRLTQPNDTAVKLAGPTLENSFLARLDERCQVTGFARLKATPHVAARAQQVALHDLAFSVGDGTPTSEASFLTTLGTLRTMVAASPEAPGVYVRKPLNYTARWSPRMEGVALIDGLVTISRGQSPWFEELRGEEELGGGPVEFSKTEWSAKQAAVDAAALSTASRKLDDYVWENTFVEHEEARTQLGGDDDDHARRVELARTTTFDQALGHFGALVAAGANINEQWRDLSAFLDAHPDQIEAFVDTVTDDDFPPGAKAPAFLALGEAKTPVAREALLGVYRDRESGTADRIRSSLALVTRADVGAPLARELRTEALRKPATTEEAAVSRQAVLHLGILSGTHPGQSDLLSEATELMQTLTATAKTPEDYSVLCGAVGNMAELSMLPQIATWSQLPDPALRQKVPQALRRYRVDRVHDLLVSWVERERDPDVLRELFNVMHHMYVDAGQPIDTPLVQAALRHLREQPKVLTRQSLYHLLAPHVGDATVRATLEAQLKFELEERSGLYSLLAQDLPAESVFAVLSTLPSVRGQFGGALKPGATSAPPPVVDSPMPAPPEGFEAAIRGAQ